MMYTPHTPDEVKAMLKTVGVRSLTALYADVPDDLRLKKLALPKGMTQPDTERLLTTLAAKNKQYSVILRGAGAYNHYIPPVVRSLSARSEFVTAYTPYQAELSQGILQSIFEYQTMICELTGMDVSNASHYDGATAAAEAILMCVAPNRKKVLVSGQIRPDTRVVMQTYLREAGIEIIEAIERDGHIDIPSTRQTLDASFCAVYVEQPNFNGEIIDLRVLADLAHAAGAKLVTGVNPIAMGLLKRPGDCGADIAVGEGQPLGMPMAFGGPYLGFMATTKALQRKLPGRIVGETVDHNGERAYVLTLQAREQHIRREKASSNICSNEAHCALVAGMYLTTMGPKGLADVAAQCVANAHYLCDRLVAAGLNKTYCGGDFFHEFVTDSTIPADTILAALAKRGILGGLKLSATKILWCATEQVTKKDMDKTAKIIGGLVSC